MSQHTIEIVKISPCIIPDNKPYNRTAPREAHLQPDDYQEKFDYKTLSFDTFYSEGKVILSGPPLYGLEKFIENGKILLDDQDHTQNIKTIHFDRTQSNHITQIETQPHELTWEYEDVSIHTQVNNHFLNEFKGKKVLFTLSKNNKFEWIYDWILFYKKYHHIDTVLFYDNNSNNYSLDELKNYLEEKELDVDIYLVPWNFKYGPQGGIYSGKGKTPWDSDFCQYGMFEHAKHRFLKYSAGVINADIDELVITPNGSSIFELLADHKGLLYPGYWIQSIPLGENKETRFFNYAYRSKDDKHSDNKWCINPSKLDDQTQWKVHSIRKTNLKSLKGVYYAHFKAINYNWKTQRVDNVSYNESKHYIDHNVYTQLNNLFPHESPKIALSSQTISTGLFEKIKAIFKA
ncbi:glycosyltransferase family protein [Acinetobacter wuhouensis]|uniref:Glycosyltransferase family 92 protein n=1 Tax=Acinetobacter wuhouensis TaxID=1879050 RepID=A0A3G2SZG6_9GAMM|nr:hypothetical protein [Acinetobacter wuhouensis]AYO53264.1 hypothetical protein CDG68_06130 [Acinetobacter wuhouensis]